MTTLKAEIAGQLPTTPVARWEANIEAIRLLKELQAQERPATPAERAVLARYSGFGDSAFEQGFSPYTREPAWKDRKEALQELVTGNEYEAMKRSRLNAFYTTPEIIKAMWAGLQDMGAGDIPNLKVLEPSAGSGRFLAYQPPEMAASSHRTAVELDDLTAGVLKARFPDATVWNSGFQDAPVPDDHFDVAISNVPFGNYGVHDPEYLERGQKHLTTSIHNYFFAKALDKLRPGGMLAFVTTHYTLDSEKGRRFREYLAEQADLVGAVRLPEDAFPDTDVVTDIIYLRKRAPGEVPGNTDWVETVPQRITDSRGISHPFTINRHFMDNPGMVLGGHSAAGSMYRDQSYTVKSAPGGQSVTGALKSAMRRIAGSPLKLTTPIPAPVSRPPRPPAVPETALESPSAQDEEDRERLLKMADIRTTARRLIASEKGREVGEDVERIRARLNEQYQGFVDAHGELNHPANRSLLRHDQDGALLMALETFDQETETWVPSSIFSRSLAGGEPERNVTNAADAMSVVVNESGALDFQRMGQLLGESPDVVRDALAADGLVFLNPMGGWESADEYLTGRVRKKLEVARRVAAAYPAYQANVPALEAVQPEDISADQIATPLGAPWIPAAVVNGWVARHLSGNPRVVDDWFRYSPEAGEWSYALKVYGNDATMKAEWGTPQMAADDILVHALRGMPINVSVTDDEGRRVKDLDATLAAREKARQMQESFDEWIWEDQARQDQLARLYNDTHNATRPRVFDGSHLRFPGMDPRWQAQLREHQRDAIFRVVHDGTALLAHEVGFGKTAVMVGSGMERKRLGLIDKPIFVVPKATHEQFARDFCGMYPGADLLFPDEGDFSNEKREAFLNRIATGDWDGVILTSEQFQKIPVSSETEAKWVQSQVDDLRSSLEELSNDEGTYSRRGRESRTQKGIQKKLEKLTVRLKDLRADMRAGSDKGVLHFEDLGIDQIYVDEADRYKNLPFGTKMGQIKGLPNTESKRAWDMFLKTQYIQGLGQRKSGSFSKNGVVFATGTPIANTIAEAWTMMRYLQLPELRRRGLHHFDAWAKTYGEVTSGLEQTPQGQYKPTQRFARFVNLPELSQLFQNVADVRVVSEVPEMVAVRPRLIDDDGNPRKATIKAEAYPALREYMGRLRYRVERMDRSKPEEDNMLLVSSDARKASLDLRMVDPGADPNPNGKIQLAAEKIADIYRAEEKDKGTQLVFLDMGTPKAAGRKSTEDSASEPNAGEELTGAEAGYVNNLYGILKRELIDRGVDESDIAFVQEYPPKKREGLFEKVNDGDVRVLVGSTETVGVGVNVQKRAAALHHLDVPWRPRDIEQREGRIIRQGNSVYGPAVDEESGEVTGAGRGVKIYQYVQEGSFDEFMWQAVEVKGQAVKALMKRHTPNRAMEDVDPLVLSAAEAKALASGNPLVLRAEELKNSINMLRLERASQRNQRENAKSQITRLERVIESYRDRIPKMELDARLAQAGTGGAGMTIAGKVIEKRAQAGEAIQEQLTKTRLGSTTGVIGQYKGFDLRASSTDQGCQLTITNPATETPYNSNYIQEVSPTGLMARLDNLVNGIPKALDNASTKFEESNTSRTIYREQAGKSFERSGEQASLERELESVQAQRSGDLKPGDLPVTDPTGPVPGAVATLPSGHPPTSTDTPSDLGVVLEPVEPPPDRAPASLDAEPAPHPDSWEGYLQPNIPAPDSAGPEYWEQEWGKAQREREAAITEQADGLNSGPDAAPPSSRDASVDDREYLDTLAAHGESDQVDGDAESNSLDDALETGLDPESEQREPTSPGGEVGPDASQLDPADEGQKSSESAPPAPHEAGLGIHLLELDGRFIYAGTVPIQLAHARPDGSPLTPEQIESVKRFGLPSSSSIGPMEFSSQDEALAAAHATGVPVVLRPGNVPVETAPFAITSAPEEEAASPPSQPDSQLLGAPMTAAQSRQATVDLDVHPLTQWEQDYHAVRGDEPDPVNDLDLSPSERWERDLEGLDRDDTTNPLIADFLEEDEEEDRRKLEERSQRDEEYLRKWFARSREQDQSPGSLAAAGDASGPPEPDLTESPAGEAFEQVAAALDARDSQRLDDLGIHNDQEKVKRLEELEDRADAVGASDLAEDIRETRRQDPEIIVASEISGLQEAVAVAEEMAPESETEDPEPSLVQRIRQCIGDDAPKPEKLIEVYVNGDAEDRAYLDGLGVGDLAARHGHRVSTEDAALVEDSLDDGWVTGEEASAAGRVQNLAERETPDPIVPSYSITQEEFEERIRELCDDPQALAAFEEQVEAEAASAKRERKFKAKQLGEDPAAAAAQDVSDDLRSEAGEALGKRARQAAADRDGLLEGLQGEEREQAREELEAAGVLTPRKRTWTAKQLRKKAKELCPPGSAIRQTRGARRSTLPKPPKPPSTSAPKARRRAKKPAFTAGMRR